MLSGACQRRHIAFKTRWQFCMTSDLNLAQKPKSEIIVVKALPLIVYHTDKNQDNSCRGKLKAAMKLFSSIECKLFAKSSYSLLPYSKLEVLLYDLRCSQNPFTTTVYF